MENSPTKKLTVELPTWLINHLKAVSSYRSLKLKDLIFEILKQEVAKTHTILNWKNKDGVVTQND